MMARVRGDVVRVRSVEQFRPDRPRTNGIGGDACCAQFQCPNLDHPDQPRLGSRISGAQLFTQRRAGRDVDDPPEPRVLHARQHGLEALQWSSVG